MGRDHYHILELRPVNRVRDLDVLQIQQLKNAFLAEVLVGYSTLIEEVRWKSSVLIVMVGER